MSPTVLPPPPPLNLVRASTTPVTRDSAPSPRGDPSKDISASPKLLPAVDRDAKRASRVRLVNVLQRGLGKRMSSRAPDAEGPDDDSP